MLNPVSASQKAFTLAEVLITLAIIGVVAALTIPTVVRNYTEKQTVVRLKKAYTVLSQAVNMAKFEHGEIKGWNWGTTNWDGETALDIFSLISPYLKLQKNCGLGQGCWYNGYLKSLDGINFTSRPNFDTRREAVKFLFADGTSGLFAISSAATPEALIFVDINGAKPPNQAGRDVFMFYLHNKKGVTLPAKSHYDCSIEVSHRDNGRSCSRWVIEHENLDYLKTDIAW